MSRGEIVEQGTHDDLYARDGMYRGLVDAQRTSAQHTGEAGESTPEDTDEDEVINPTRTQSGPLELQRSATGGSHTTVRQNNSGVIEKTKYSGSYILKRVCSF